MLIKLSGVKLLTHWRMEMRIRNWKPLVLNAREVQQPAQNSSTLKNRQSGTKGADQLGCEFVELWTQVKTLNILGGY